MADWSFLLVDPVTDEQNEIAQSQGRMVTFALDDPSTAECSVALEDEVAGLVTPFVTDLLVARDGTDLHRGRLAEPLISGGTDDLRMGLNSTDYRGMLDKWGVVPAAGVTATAVDQALIAWNLIDAYQTRTGGARGITRGIGQTSGQLRDRTFEPGAPIGSLIADMGRVINGFDWEIGPDLAFDMWHHSAGGRGSADVAVLEYGSLIKSFQRSRRDFSNAWTTYGDDETTTPRVSTAADVGTDPRGRWENSRSFTDISVQSTLNDRGDYLLENGNGRRSWTLEMVLGAWGGPTELWLGDTFTLAIDVPGLAVDSLCRVIELSVSLGDSDEDERVSLGVVEV